MTRRQERAEDWLLVPRRPTEAMSNAGEKAYLAAKDYDGIYRAMIARRKAPTKASTVIDIMAHLGVLFEQLRWAEYVEAHGKGNLAGDEPGNNGADQ